MITQHSIEGKDIPTCKKLRMDECVLMVNSFQIKTVFNFLGFETSKEISLARAPRREDSVLESIRALAFLLELFFWNYPEVSRYA
jgi:hypothetical protein